MALTSWLAAPAAAQIEDQKKLQLGFKIGGVIGQVTDERRTQEPQFVTVSDTISASRLAFGPFVDYRFAKKISFETGFLYRGVDRTLNRVEINRSYNEVTSGSRLDVPFLVKYWWGDDETFPYVFGGPTLGAQLSTSGTATTVTPPTDPTNPTGVTTVTSNVSRGGGAVAGLTGGAGFSKIVWRLKWSAEVRYTYWTSTTHVPKAHEVLGLVGISF